MTAAMEPEKFGRYVLLEKIGVGGMADVFKAMTHAWEGFRRIIVVKRIRRELSESPDFLRMFFEEAKISSLLDHPNIVQVYDFGQVEGAYFLAMEYLEGKDLASVTRVLRGARQALEPSLAAHIAREVALGLHYAHTLRSAEGQPFNIIHRDVNPANVMLLRTGGVKLLDFGIAKASEAAGKSQTQNKIVKGKLRYLSPEQATAMPLDGRSDIFSLGSTMWEMLAGQRLFSGKTDYDRLQNVKGAPIYPPSVRQPEIPRELDRIVLRALERNVSRRYQSANELAHDLEAFLQTAPVEPHAVEGLLTDLFGYDPVSASISVSLVPSGTGSDNPRTVTGPGPLRPSQTLEFDPRPPSVHAPLGPGEVPGNAASRLSARRPAGWIAGAALLVAAFAVVLWVVRATPGGHRPSANASLSAPVGSSLPAGGSGARAAIAPGEGVVKIDVDSEPSGAIVRGSAGALGKTPLTLTLPASGEVERLHFEKPGFVSTTYDVRPQSGGVVFVELQRVPGGPL
jgi:serine/threonine protein kinase